MSTDFGVQQIPRPQTRAESAPVQGGYESLDVDGTKKTFEELNAVLDGLANVAVQTVDQVIPYLAKMQALLSQRGADRKKVLQQAGLPGWTRWARAYARKLDRSLRTIQDRIKRLRGSQASGNADPSGKTKRASNVKRLKLDSRQQAVLVKSQVAANDLVAALDNGGDWQRPLAEYKKVAVAPARLDSFVNALSPEPDWKNILAEFADILECCGGELPMPAINALRSVQKLLGGKHVQDLVPVAMGREVAPPEKSVDYPLRKAKAQPGSYRRKKESQLAAQAATPAPQSVAAPAPKQGRVEKAGKHTASPKVKVCPPALSPDEEEQIAWRQNATPAQPGARQGDYVLTERGAWEFDPPKETINAPQTGAN